VTWTCSLVPMIRASPTPMSRIISVAPIRFRESKGVQTGKLLSYTGTCTPFCLSFLLFVLTDALQLMMLIPRFLRRSQAPLTSLTRSHSLLRRSFASTSWRSRSVLQADEDTLSKLPGLDASKLSITKTITPKKIVPPEDLVFGRTFTGPFVGVASPLRMLLIQSPS
jgi:hypothetical protein